MIIDKYVNLFTDFGFKKLFGTEINKDLLIDLLNELIKEQGTITKLTYLSNEHLGNTIVDRKAIFDLYCENEHGEKFIVELQKAKQNFFKDRSIFYSTFPIQEQAKQGNWDFELKAVYTIGILDFVFAEDQDSADYFHHEVKLMETKRKEVFYDKLTFIYLEMPKFNKTEDQLITHFDKWMYILKNLSKLDHRPEKLKEKIFEKIFRSAEIEQFTREERQRYESSLKYYRDINNIVDTSFSDGILKGIEKGKVEGKIEGIAEGIEKGKIEGKIEGIAEGIEKGKIEGKTEGIAEGMEKGRQEGLIAAYQRLVENGISSENARQMLGLRSMDSSLD